MANRAFPGPRPVRHAARRGGVLAEFGLAAPIFLLVLVASVEFGVEAFSRLATEYAAAAAASSYRMDGDIAAADAAAADAVPGFVARCLEPLDVRLVESVAGRDMARADVGRPAAGTAADASAVAARLSLRCSGARLTPLVRETFGADMTHDAIAIVRRP